MGDIKEKLFSHPFAPFLKPLRMARGAKSPRATGKYDQPLLATLGTADAGKPAARIAAVQVALDHLLDNGPEETVLLLEAALIFYQELVEVMEQHPVEDSALGMAGAIDSWHGKDKDSGNGPEEASDVLSSGNNRT
jgi:hypothetical protein